MKPFSVTLALFATCLLAVTNSHAADLANLRVLYIGSERADDYVGFLKDHVRQVDAKSRADFRPSDAEAFDVVLFDWPQSEETREMRKLASPLGTRDEWKKPTVLLGSAGLNLAVCWKLRGGSGCTCLDPIAYDLREHEIFERPFRIDRNRMISIPTPKDFAGEIDAREIQVLPLVDDPEKRWKAGWCTHAPDFPGYPDIEFFSGGINRQTPTSGALWRQGNLLHFGFEQSPAEMNESGRFLLLNAIAYIVRFTEDRPIAVTPSIFAGPVAPTRRTVARWLRKSDYSPDFVKAIVAADVWKKLADLPDREKQAAWADEHARFLHPEETKATPPDEKARQGIDAARLTLDEDLVALGVPFDDPRFFGKTIADLGSSDTAIADRARRLLERYAPVGVRVDDASTWQKWWSENRAYLFASDVGDYRWYIDPLAKERSVPTIELRGSRRADRK